MESDEYAEEQSVVADDDVEDDDVDAVDAVEDDEDDEDLPSSCVCA